MINAVTTLNIGFRGHKESGVPVTQKHIDIITDPARRGVIEQLDNMGLINKSMLQRVKKAAILQEAQISAKNADTVFDIVRHPRFMVEQKDNGYWFETESKYDYKKTVQNYASGQKYSTPVFSREREYKKALENLAKKGRPEDISRLEKLMKQMESAKPLFDHVETLRKINKDMRLHFCIPQEGGFGKLIPLNRQNAFQFVSDALYAPLKAMFEAAARKLPKTIK